MEILYLHVADEHEQDLSSSIFFSSLTEQFTASYRVPPIYSSYVLPNSMSLVSILYTPLLGIRGHNSTNANKQWRRFRVCIGTKVGYISCICDKKTVYLHDNSYGSCSLCRHFAYLRITYELTYLVNCHTIPMITAG